MSHKTRKKPLSPEKKSTYMPLSHKKLIKKKNKNTKENIEQNEAWYRTIFETSGTAMIVIEEDTTISLANENAVKLAGFDKKEIEGKKKWTDFVVKEDLERMKTYHMLRRANPESAPKDYEFRLIDKHGNIHDILLKINMIPGTKKSIASLQDITELKRIERALQESEKNYKALFENAVEGIFKASPDGRFLSLNPAIARMHGFSSPDEMKSEIKNIFKQLFVKTEDIEAMKRLLKEHDIIKSFEALQYKKDGTNMWVSLNVRTIRDENNKTLYYTGYAEDITKRKEAEENLKRLRELESSILRAIPHAVIGIKNQIIIFVNEGVKNIFGYSPEELIGKSIRIFYRSDEDYEKIKNMVYPALEKERVCIDDFICRRKDGNDIFCRVSAAAIGETFNEKEFVIVYEDITEQKKAEYALRENRALYESLVEESFDGIFIHDTNSIIFANRRLHEMLGYEYGELVGLSPIIVTHPSYREIVSQNVYKRMLGENPPERYEIKVLRKDGTSLDVEIYAHAIALDRQFVIQVWVRDITERKRAEAILKSSEERYRTVIESSNDAITIVHNGHHVYVNKRFYEITGYSEQEIIAKPINNWIHPEDKERVMNISIARENQKDAPSRYEFKGLRKDGTIIYIEVSATQINYLNKTMSLAFLRDITERKQVEIALNQEREKFSTLIKNIPFGMAMVDKKGHYLYINAIWKELFGYDPSEIPDGKTWFRKVFPDPSYRKKAIAIWIEDTKDALPGLKKTRSFTLTCKDGTQKIVNFTFIPIQNDLYIIICEDVTELKRIEEQLIQSQKMEAVGRLAGGIAHDFNNMLTIILGHTQLAQLTLDENNPFYHRFLEIQKAAQRSAALTKNLLAFARKQTIAPRALNINHQIEDILKMLRRLIGENIELIWMPQSNLWNIKIDPSQLNQIIINIVINAKDAIEDLGTITIETQNVIIDENYCKTHLGFTAGEYVMIAISDNGTGMDKDVLEHIFEPFFTTKGIEKGSGLGLSTVYGIVKQNNGFINVYSEPKKGSTFKIYFPRYVGHKEEPIDLKKDIVIKSKGETVLIVEDERDVLDLCTSMLEELGYKVLIAPSPNEAIKKTQTYEEEIHLLITDVIMPEMNGKELADKIKSIKPAIKCLFMSGYTANAIVKNGILQKGVNYIQKPFSLQELSVKVREAIEA